MFMNGFVLRKFRQVTVLFTLFAAQSLYAQRPSPHLAAYVAKNTQLADSVVWKLKDNKLSAHLYRDDLDTTRYGGVPISQELERALDAYGSSSYLHDDGMLVKEAFLKSLRVLSDNQVRVLLGDSRGEAVMSISLYLHKGKCACVRKG